MARPIRASEQEITGFLDTAPGWRHEDGALVRSATAPRFLDGVRWVTQVADFAERVDHHPDIDIRWRTVTFALVTHSQGGITDQDVDLARQIDDLLADR